MKNAWFAAVVLAVLGMAATSFGRGGGHGGGGHHGGGHHGGGHHGGHHAAHHAHHHGHVQHHTGHHADYHHGGWHGHHDGWHSWHHGYWGGWNSYPGIWNNGWAASNYTYRNPFWNDAYAGTVNYAQPITTSSYTDDTQVAGAAAPVNNPLVATVQSDVNDQDDATDANDDGTDETKTADADDDNDSDDDVGPSANEKQALAQFDAGREAFRAGNYAEAQKLVEGAIKLWPEDVIAHEFRALTLFAQQKYRESAAATYAVLAGGPGWNEQTLLSFYPDRNQYEGQLAALKSFVRQDPKAADAEFLLAYHQLIAGHRDAARAELERVAQAEPNDQLTSQLIKALNVEPAAAVN